MGDTTLVGGTSCWRPRRTHGASCFVCSVFRVRCSVLGVRGEGVEFVGSLLGVRGEGVEFVGSLFGVRGEGVAFVGSLFGVRG